MGTNGRGGGGWAHDVGDQILRVEAAGVHHQGRPRLHQDGGDSAVVAKGHAAVTCAVAHGRDERPVGDWEVRNKFGTVCWWRGSAAMGATTHPNTRSTNSSLQDSLERDVSVTC